MVTSSEIKELLDAGYSVYSVAAGRVGPVLDTDADLACVNIRGEYGVTRFDRGDPCEIVWNDRRKQYMIRNVREEQ